MTAVLLLTGCSASEGQTATLQLPAKNQAQWAMPLDRYVVTNAQLARQSYATAILLQKCLADKGFVRTVPLLHFERAQQRGAGIINVFDRDVASKSGYHTPQLLSPGDQAAWNQYLTAPRSDGELAASDSCNEEMGDTEPSYGNQSINFAMSFVGAALNGARTDSKVLEAADEWTRCMASSGVEDLPRTPEGMPSDSLRQKFGLKEEKDKPAGTEVSALETHLALADAECRETSKYSAIRYQAEWNRQVSLLKENFEALEAAGKKISATDARISRVISKYAPAS